MKKNDDIYELALKVAHLYYYNQLTTEAIAKELKMSRPTISRLLNFARNEGLVEIKIIDKNISINPIEKKLLKRFKNLKQVKIVPATDDLHEFEITQRVAQSFANELDDYLENIKYCGISWHPLIYEVSKNLTPKKLEDLIFIPTHGLFKYSNTNFINLLHNFSNNYSAKYLIYPIPIFLDYPSTKNLLLQENFISNLNEMQNSCEVYIFSVSELEGQLKSHYLIKEGFLSEEEVFMMKGMDVIGEISAMFYKKNGHYQNIPINTRSTGLDLNVLKSAKSSVCVVSSKKGNNALFTALEAGYITDLIIDEISAKELIKLIKI